VDTWRLLLSLPANKVLAGLASIQAMLDAPDWVLYTALDTLIGRLSIAALSSTRCVIPWNGSAKAKR
jgi:hypothetical protein